MKRVLGVMLCVLALIAYFPPWSAEVSEKTSTAAATGEPHRAASKQPIGSPVAMRLNAVNGTGQEDVEALHELVTQYLQALQRRQGPPIGDDMDLARVLRGRNPMRLPVISPDHPAFSPDGHLRDRWGTPFHIHARSAASYQIRSAGQDRTLFTKDDFVAPALTE